ncbi:MAG: hypothetical protein AB1668_06615 [Nanoarchaeota archaeon]
METKTIGALAAFVAIASAPLAFRSLSCDDAPRLDYSRNPPLERRVNPKEQVADELNNRLRHWQSTPSYETAKKWLVGYNAPELPNQFAYFVVRDTGLVGESRVRVEEQEETGIKIELDYAYAQKVLAESARLDAQRLLNTGNFGGFP